jgi:hypothetical protein
MPPTWDTFMPTLTDRINAAIQANDTQTGRIPMGKGPQQQIARTYISPTDSYENEIGPDMDTQGFAPGATRGMWSIADQQQASVPVTQLTKSGATRSNAIAAIQGGIPQNPRAPATTWAAVPQMMQHLNVTGPIMIQASLSVRSSAASDRIAFAIYRDGQLIGNHLTHTTPSTASATSLVQLSAMDTPPSGNHLYALYWSPGTGTLVANSNQRNLYVINLTPQ